MSDTERLKQVCKPEFDTACFAEAVQQWHQIFAEKNERVGYLDMTLTQRTWVNRRAQEIKTGTQSTF